MLLKLITAELVKANTISWEVAHWWSLSLDEEEEEEENTNLLRKQMFIWAWTLG